MHSCTNRKKGQHRTPGICWCCASSRPVRPCAYWLDGIVRDLCAECERTQLVLKPCNHNCDYQVLTKPAGK